MLIQLTELLYVWIFVLFYCLILLTQNYVIEIDKSLRKLYFASVSLDAGLNCNKKYRNMTKVLTQCLNTKKITLQFRICPSF
jgi:hypothetical protein